MKFHKKNFYRLIGTNIYSARKKEGLSQDELGKKIGLMRTSVTNIEKGKQRLSIAKLYEISFALDIDVFDLLPKKDELIHASKATLPEGLSNQETKTITDILNSVGIEVDK